MGLGCGSCKAIIMILFLISKNRGGRRDFYLFAWTAVPKYSPGRPPSILPLLNLV